MVRFNNELMEFGSCCSAYLWTFRNFSKLGVREKELKAPVIKFAGTEWTMEMSIRKKDENGDFTIAVSLKTDSCGVSKMKVHWNVSLVSKNGSEHRMKEGEMRCLKPECIEIFKISRNLLQNMDFLDLLPNDCLSVCLELMTLNMFPSQAFWKSFQGNESQESIRNLSGLSSDFLALLQSGEQTDVVLHVGNQSFPAHKLILTARSKVLARKLLQDADGKSRYSVFIDDVEACDVKLILQYLYSGTVPEMPIDRIYSLYASASKYEIAGLQRKCVQLIANISKENFGGIQVSQECKELKAAISEDLMVNENTCCIYKFLRKYSILLVFILILFLPFSSIRSYFPGFSRVK